MFGKRIGVDLGTANVLVYVKGRGIVINEPSVVAVAQRDNSIVAVGQEARDMLGRTPGAIQVIRPMREGVIADYITTEAMLRYFISRVIGRVSVIKPEVMICVPAGVTGVEQRAVQDAAEAAGARRPANIIPEPLAAAIGARIPVNVPQGHMIVDIGGGRTEAAIISMYGIVVTESVRVAGDRLDDAIANHVKRRHNIIIGDRTAEELKIAIGSALPVEEEMSYQVRGRDQITGLPRTITVTSTDVAQGISDSLQSIVGAVRSVLERTPPELASDVADNPLECVAMGAGIALDHLDLIKRSMPAEGEWLVSF
jgi:rod shape-determining protein MreB